MKKVLIGFFFAVILLAASPTTNAAVMQIHIDGVAITSDVKPEVKNNRTMVPLRVISENLGASVEWTNSEVTLAKSDMKVRLNLNSNTAEKNGEKIQLDVKPYIKNNRIFVPLRFIAETFDCKVNYNNQMVTVSTEPLVIDDVQVSSLQHEYRMTMGGVVQQTKGNAILTAIHKVFLENKGQEVEAPADYSWRGNIDILGSYSKVQQYDFLDLEGNSLKRLETYYLLKSIPGETYEGYPEVLLYDATQNHWYLFNDAAQQAINQLLESAQSNGFTNIISNTVV